jgi:amino acid transporter
VWGAAMEMSESEGGGSDRVRARVSHEWWRRLGQAIVGRPRDVYAPAAFAQVTVGALLAWIAVGGDLLGSCVYGPDTLGRAVTSPAMLLLVGVATLLTLAIFAAGYHRLNRRFLHGGGGYTAARALLGERTALVSGIALVLDAGVDVAISVVFCTEALAPLVPAGLHWLKLPIELLIIVALTAANVRGIREPAKLLAPILVFFVLTHLWVLGWALVGHAGNIPAQVAATPEELGRMEGHLGFLPTLRLFLVAFIASGAMYTGIECVSNAAPMLREPKARTSKRAMLLVAGVPALIIAVIVLGYVAYGVLPEGDKVLNAVLFERIAAQFAGARGAMPLLLVAAPLVAEALVLVVAAQTGFSDGPRTLAALARDRFVPRSLMRLNGRMMPERGSYFIGALAVGTTLLVGGHLGPLVAIFVVCVFVTIALSQAAMLKDALAAPSTRERTTGLLVHGAAALLALVILVGTVVTNLRTVALAAPLLIGGLAVLCWRLRRRQSAVAGGIEGGRALQLSPSSGDLVSGPAPAADGRWIVVLVGESAALGRAALAWVRRELPDAAGVTFASIALVDAETIHGAGLIREVEDTRQRELEALATEARALGFTAGVELRRAADLITGASELAIGLAHARSQSVLVVGCRAAVNGSPIDRLVRDDVAGPIAARLAKAGVPMAVLEPRAAHG